MVTEAVSGAGGARGRDFEAVVIGAGPAGSVAAFVLARRGMRVLLVERRAFPRDKVCGGCLAPAGAATLEALGMIRGGFSFDGDRVFGPSLSRVRVLGGGDVLGHRGFTLPLRPYVAVERRGFDAALVAAAVAEGVVFRDGTAALVLRDGGVRLRAVEGVERHGAGSAGTAGLRDEVVRGGVVVAADGIGGGSLRDLPAFAWRVRSESPVGLGAMVASGAGSAGGGSVRGGIGSVEAGEVVMVAGRGGNGGYGGYVGLADLGQGRTAIAAAVPPEAVRGCGPAGAVAGLLDDAGLRDMAAVAADGGTVWRGVGPLTRRRATFAHGRVMVVGDAARYVEPITGEGMSWGIVCAAEIGPFAEAVVDGGSCGSWERRCNGLLRVRGAVCRAAVWAAGSATVRRITCGVERRSGAAGVVTRAACFGRRGAACV